MTGVRTPKIPTFSFIIPVYNTEMQLRGCLESIISQSEFSIELIIIDDGSTDGSSDICNEYAKNYPFVRLIRKPNEGQGVARNVGIAAASGEIVCFVDSDDQIEENYCREIATAFDSNEVDFVNFGCVFETDGGDTIKTFTPHQISEMQGLDIFLNALLIREILSSPCTKAYRRRFLTTNNILFPAIRANEDILFSCLVARAARRTRFLPVVLYRVLVRPGSTSRAMSVGTFKETEKMIDMALVHFHLELKSPEVARHFEAHIVRVFTYLAFQGAVRLHTSSELREAFECADRCGLSRLVRHKRSLALLPLKNRLMARLTQLRPLFRPIVRILHLTGIRAY